jgi:emp24/gp25L/p24 family/GOLD
VLNQINSPLYDVIQIPQQKEQLVQHVIDVQVESPSGKAVYSGHGRQSDEGHFLVLFPGIYTFCFSSRQLNAAEATNQTQSTTQSTMFLQFGLRLADGGPAWKEQQQKLQQQQASQRELDKIENALLKEKLNRTFANGEQVRTHFKLK